MKLNEKNIEKLAILMKNKRIEFNYTLEQVRLKLLSLGVPAVRSDIQRVEEGNRKIPNPMLISGMCKIYEIDTIEVFKNIGYIVGKDLTEKDLKVMEVSKKENLKNNKDYLDLTKLNKKDAESIKAIYRSLLKK